MRLFFTILKLALTFSIMKLSNSKHTARTKICLVRQKSCSNTKLGVRESQDILIKCYLQNDNTVTSKKFEMQLNYEKDKDATSELMYKVYMSHKDTDCDPKMRGIRNCFEYHKYSKHDKHGYAYYEIKGNELIVNFYLTTNDKMDGYFSCTNYKLDDQKISVDKVRAELDVNTFPLIHHMYKHLSYIEGEVVLFACKVSLGRPVGSITMSYETKSGEKVILDPTNIYRMNDRNSSEVKLVYAANFIAEAKHHKAAIRCDVSSTITGQLQKNTDSGQRKLTVNEMINVQYAVKEIIHQPYQLVFHPGETITCFAKGNPKPTYTWIRSQQSEGELLSSNDQLKIQSMASVGWYTYTCVAQNIVNKEKKFETLTITFLVTHKAKYKDLTDPRYSILIGLIILIVIVVAFVKRTY